MEKLPKPVLALVVGGPWAGLTLSTDKLVVKLAQTSDSHLEPSQLDVGDTATKVKQSRTYELKRIGVPASYPYYILIPIEATMQQAIGWLLEDYVEYHKKEEPF